MISTLLAASVVLASGSTHSEPMGANALTGGGFLFGIARLPETAPYQLRLGGELYRTEVGDSEEGMLASGLSVLARLGGDWSAGAALQSRSFVTAPQARMPAKLELMFGYTPALSSSGLTFGASIGAMSISNWSSSAPDAPQWAGRLDAYVGRTVGSAAVALTLNAQPIMRPGQDSDRFGVLAGGGLQGRVPILDWLAVQAEVQGAMAREDSGNALRSLGSLGLTARVLNVQTQIAGLVERRDDGVFAPGGLLAITIQLGQDDLDGDSVRNEEDACPGRVGEAAYQGCPFEDDDGDGVWQRVDACPETAGTTDGAGCPIADEELGKSLTAQRAGSAQ